MASRNSLSKRAFLSPNKAKGKVNRYGDSHFSGDSSAVLGDVYNHFYPENAPTVPFAGSHEPNGASSGVLRRLGLTDLDLDSISDYDHEYEHYLRAHRRTEGTCEWLLHSPQFEAWAAHSGPPILVCVGSLGCGKSILASAVVDQLSRQDDDNLVVSFYTGTTDARPMTTTGFLRALIKQLVNRYVVSGNPVPSELSSKVRNAFSSASSANIYRLRSILVDFLRLSPTTSVVVDGIDSFSEQEILSFVSLLRELWPATASVSYGRIILFCRETLGRCVRLDTLPSANILQIKLHHLKPDLCLYVDLEVDRRQRERPITKECSLIQEIKDILKTKCEKMFLWIYLQLITIWDPGMTTSDQDIRDQLAALPDGLDEIYIRCLFRIHSTNDGKSRDIAPRVFKWVSRACQPLTPAQAQEIASMSPERISIQPEQILNNPVTDYCANLVIFEGGIVKFTHPSVKDFLADTDKVPSELSYLRLSAVEDDLWCGSICLAYATLHHSRRQLVRHQTQTVDTNIVNPLISNVLGTRLPFGLKKLLPAPSKTTNVRISVPMSDGATTAAPLRLHDYMCKHWLSHNTSTHNTRSNYSDFEGLCLSHDADLQPWAIVNFVNAEHYQRMVSYAVLTNHVPLLIIVIKYLTTRKRKYFDDVFRTYVPGTGSTFLHIASALGHVQIVQALRAFISADTVDEAGETAVVAAIKAGQYRVLKILLKSHHETSWPILNANQKLARSAREYPLDFCAKNGHLEAAEVILGHFVLTTQTIEQSNIDIDSAFFLACRHGHSEVCRLLIRYGADPMYFDPLRISRVISLTGKSTMQPVLRVALELRDPKMMETLLELDRSFPLEDDETDLICLLETLQCSREEAAPFVRLLLNHGKILRQSIPEGSHSLWWFERLIDPMKVPMLSDRDRDFYLRLMLPSVPRPPSNLPRAVGEDSLTRWMKRTTDDILVHLININWFPLEFLYSQCCLLVAVKRDTSRLLESTLVFSCRADEQRLFSLFGELIPATETVSIGVQTMLRVLIDNNTEDIGTGYLHRFPPFLRDALLQGRLQILEFFFCHAPGLVRMTWLSYHRIEGLPIIMFIESLRKALCHSPQDTSGDEHLTLMWMRCFQKMKGNVEAAGRLCIHLCSIGADGNFALNAPEGYSSTLPSSNRPYTIRRSIWLALHRWNFRLNRSHKRAFTDSDMQYMAAVLRMASRRRYTPDQLWATI